MKCCNKDGAADIRSTSSKKNKTDPLDGFDVLAVVQLEKKAVFLIPKSKLKNYKRSISINSQAIEYWRENIYALTDAAKEILGGNLPDSSIGVHPDGFHEPIDSLESRVDVVIDLSINDEIQEYLNR